MPRGSVGQRRSLRAAPAATRQPGPQPHGTGHLIWRAWLSSGRWACRPLGGRGGVMWPVGRCGLRRRAVSLICAGWLPHDRGALGAVGWSRDRASPAVVVAWLLIGVSRVAPRAVGVPPHRPARMLGQASKTARLQHQPASSRATATTLTVERLARASSRHQPSGMAVAGLGDRTLGAAAAAGLLAGHQAQPSAEGGPGEAMPVADLHRQAEAGQHPDPTQAAQPAHQRRPGRCRGQLADGAVQAVAAGLDGQHRPMGFVNGHP